MTSEIHPVDSEIHPENSEPDGNQLAGAADSLYVCLRFQTFSYMRISKSILPSVIMLLLLSVLHPADLAADSRERFFQFGLFPPISSNGLGSDSTVNSISVNLIGGLNAGTRIFELGGVWNASKEFSQGLQIAGLLNYSSNSRNSVQISGMANIAASGDSPVQIAGLVNVGENVSGLQLSALVNVAQTVKGVQFGLINFMEDGEHGVSVGLINIARHGGKYEFEISVSDAVNTMLSFRMGTDRFYTIFSGGVNYFFSDLEYAAGLGFGTDIKWGQGKWSNQVEIQVFGISNGQKFTGGSVNSIIQLRLPVCVTFAKHFKIFAGPAVNLALQSTGTDGVTFRSLAPWTMWNSSLHGMLAEGWIGFSAGLRF